jgi:tetratricopeptide (TPR) repeat protein
VSISPQSSDYHYNLGRVLAAQNVFSDALAEFEQAAKLSAEPQPAVLQMLAAMYSETGRYPEAIGTAQRALELAQQQHNEELVTSLQANLRRYEAQAKTAQN